MSTIAILGASGGVGRLIVRRLLDRGDVVAAQTRAADRLGQFAGRVRIVEMDPRDEAAYPALLEGADAAIFALGTRERGGTRLFSEATRALLSGMAASGTRRLVAITGVGAGETRGHGGFVYDRIVFPLFTRRVYADKDRQEALIETSGLDWTIVRPAPFAPRTPDGPIEIHTYIRHRLKLTRITRDEAAAFVAAEIAFPRYIREKPFIGHG